MSGFWFELGLVVLVGIIMGGLCAITILLFKYYTNQNYKKLIPDKEPAQKTHNITKRCGEKENNKGNINEL